MLSSHGANPSLLLFSYHGPAHEGAYKTGILHRDISDNNVLLTEDEDGILTDWDLAWIFKALPVFAKFGIAVRLGNFQHYRTVRISIASTIDQENNSL